MDNYEIELKSNLKVEDIIYFVKSNDTIKSISEKFCVDEMNLLEDNCLSNSEQIKEGDILWIRKKNIASYIVKPLDTLSKIASQFNVTEEHIKTLNAIEQVYIGQKIYI